MPVPPPTGLHTIIYSPVEYGNVPMTWDGNVQQWLTDDLNQYMTYQSASVNGAFDPNRPDLTGQTIDFNGGNLGDDENTSLTYRFAFDEFKQWTLYPRSHFSYYRHYPEDAISGDEGDVTTGALWLPNITEILRLNDWMELPSGPVAPAGESNASDLSPEKGFAPQYGFTAANGFEARYGFTKANGF